MPTEPLAPGLPNADQAWNTLRRTMKVRIPRRLKHIQVSIEHMQRMRRRG